MRPLDAALVADDASAAAAAAEALGGQKYPGVSGRLFERHANAAASPQKTTKRLPQLREAARILKGLDGEGDEIAPARAWTKNQKSLLTF